MQRRAYVVTTDSKHELEVYLNLAGRLKLTGINQLWVADITYIRLQKEFVYLAVILDAFSRKVVGWALDRTLAASLPKAALEMAIADRQPGPAWSIIRIVGCSMLQLNTSACCIQHGIVPSMSRPANPYDNASCESFMKTLKQEEIYLNQYRDLEHLRSQHRGLHGAVLQSSPLALFAWLSAAGRVRANAYRQPARPQGRR